MRRPLAALLVVLSCCLPARVAGADAIADKKAEAARISAELQRQGERLSILAEQYNEARLRSERIDAKLAAASKTLAATDKHASQLRSTLKGQAVDSYIRGGSVPALAALVQTKSQDDIAIRRQYVDSVTMQVDDTLDELRSVKLTLEAQQGDLQQAKAEAKQAEAEVEAKKNEAAAVQAAQRKTLAKVQGELAGLVAAEEKRKAEEEARRVQAELAARKAREEQAARDAAAREAARQAASRTRTSPSSSPSPTTTAKPATSAPTNAPPPASGADAAVAEAKRQIGKPYEWGGSGPDSFDCSGLTSWAWRAGGKSLPHSSGAQYSATSRVSMDNIAPGDLLFYGSPIHHVGIYVGGGQMVEAPESGEYVRYGSIFRRDLVGAGRVN